MKRVIATLLLLATPAQAQVSSTAAPVANSSGSVTNQAVMVTPSNKFENRYNGYTCQSTTLVISPFLSSTIGWAHPWEPYYDERIYSTVDLVGATDQEGNAIGDGEPDYPNRVISYRPVRTGQKYNYSLNSGITAQITIPLDRKAVRTCHAAAEKQVALLDAAIADRRLNYELTRLKTCASVMKDGVRFHPDSPYRTICADVILENPPGVLPPHTHSIPTSAKSSETSDAQQQTQEQSSSPESS